MTMKRNHLLFLALLTILVSCKKEETDIDVVHDMMALSPSRGIRIPVMQVPLYADLSDYNLLANPPTRESEQTVCVDSLLDYAHSKTETIGKTTYVQIPFLQNEEDVLAIVYSGEDEMDPDDATVIRKYYIKTNREGKAGEYVATMITKKSYDNGYHEFDFLHKGNYSGTIIYSSIEGKLLRLKMYKGGKVFRTKMITPGSEVESGCDEYYISLLEYGTATRNGDGVLPGQIMPAYCIGYVVPASYCYGNYGGGSSSGGGENNNNGFADDSRPYNLIQTVDEMGEAVEDVPEFLVDLQCNYPTHIQMIGSGYHAEGTKVKIEWQYLNYVSDGYEFNRWVGDFVGRPETFLYTVPAEQTSAFAYFDNPETIPCSDEMKGVTNPLKEMGVAPSGGWNYKGGTYGKTRNDGKTNHTGLDLRAIPGTSIYSMYSGVVYALKTDCPDQHIANSFGNELVIQCNVGGKTLFFQYSHLMADKPIAINPRTNRPYEVGDPVYRGELIAFSGKSGNAYKDKDVPVKHLHLGVSTDWNTTTHIGIPWIDPLPYINGTIDVDNIDTNKGRIDSVKCHSDGEEEDDENDQENDEE